MNTPRKTKTTLDKRTERYPLNYSPLFGMASHYKLTRVLFWGGTTGQLREFSRRADNYSRYVDKSKPGKERLIEAPAKRAKIFQSRILELLRRIELPSYLHSARSGHSYLSNSEAHGKAQGCTITMDIDSFYQSVTCERVIHFFQRHLRQPRDVAETLANLLCCDGHLATGSPASPLVSFWAFREIFDAIARRAQSREGVFTLYIDDIALTGAGLGHTDILWISRLFRRVGLTVKEVKTRVFHAGSPKLVTGRVWRYGVSRAPNKQHRKMRMAQAQLEMNPDDTSLQASVAGLKRHLGLLDDAKRDQHRAEANKVSARRKRREPA